MLEELRKLNQLGQKEDILFFLQKVIGKRHIAEKDIRAICAHTTGQYQLNVDSLLIYCSFLNLINCNETITLSPEIIENLENTMNLNSLIIKRTITKLFELNIFEVDLFTYNVLNHRFTFKNERLPLSFSGLRNILVSQGFLEIERKNLKTEFYINTQYEEYIASFCKPRKRTIVLEQLKKQLEQNCKAGEKAELYALQYEKQRINKPSLIEKIQIISDIDVCAGYDIVSFDSNDSCDYDRFIEVKAISNSKAFYWSINELNTAKLKGKQYYLYLIDLHESSKKNYAPIIINDPANVLINSEEWFLETQSFHIWHV